MTHVSLRSMLGALLVAATFSVAPSVEAQEAAQCAPRYAGSQPNLFYNYYSPGRCASATAAMYPSPYPVPPLVGYTYITYQPLMPHEFLYHHHNSYHRYYNNGQGLNVTRISYR